MAQDSPSGRVQYLSPDTLHQNPPTRMWWSSLGPPRRCTSAGRTPSMHQAPSSARVISAYRPSRSCATSRRPWRRPAPGWSTSSSGTSLWYRDNRSARGLRRFSGCGATARTGRSSLWVRRRACPPRLFGRDGCHCRRSGNLAHSLRPDRFGTDHGVCPFSRLLATFCQRALASRLFRLPWAWPAGRMRALSARRSGGQDSRPAGLGGRVRWPGQRSSRREEGYDHGLFRRCRSTLLSQGGIRPHPRGARRAPASLVEVGMAAPSAGNGQRPSL